MASSSPSAERQGKQTVNGQRAEPTAPEQLAPAYASIFVQQLRSFCGNLVQLDMSDLSTAEIDGLRTDLQSVITSTDAVLRRRNSPAADSKASPPRPQQSPPRQSAPDPGTSGPIPLKVERATLRVLVVDDERVARTVLKRMLALVGVECTTADGGAEAMSLLARKAQDLIFVDLEMPGMDGFQVARELRKIPGCEHAYVVAVSAAEICDARELAREAGMNDYVAKPVTKLKLQRVFETLSQAALPTEAAA